jgi:hypothetical protein
MRWGPVSEGVMASVSETDVESHPKQVEIAVMRPSCLRCRSTMTLADIHHHPRFPRVEVVRFVCACGAVERRVVPHVL